MAGTISSDLGPWIEPSLGDPLLFQQLVTPVTCKPEPEDWWPTKGHCAQFCAHFFPFDWQPLVSIWRFRWPWLIAITLAASTVFKTNRGFVNSIGIRGIQNCLRIAELLFLTPPA